jgi:AcrR family transcriptional regulator
LATINVQSTILTQYVEHCLTSGNKPTSVYQFCKNAELDETEFYQHFGSLDAVESALWESFYSNTQSLLEKDKAYAAASRKDQLLSFYFTFFEVLLLNRSYVLFALQGQQHLLSKLTPLKGLRTAFKEYATGLIEAGNDERSRWSQHPATLFSEAAWVQFLFLLKFWIDDRSKGFEKTDAAIEKSVHTAFAIFDNASLDTLVDFGKFIWKEKISTH